MRKKEKNYANCLTCSRKYDKLHTEPLETGKNGVRSPSQAWKHRLSNRRDWREEVRIFMYAIIENGNKQYKVSEGDTVKVEKLKAEVGATVEFPAVLVSGEDGVKVGASVAKVTATVAAQDKAKKIIVFKYKAKKNERKKQGHRQPFTAVKIEKIEL